MIGKRKGHLPAGLAKAAAVLLGVFFINQAALACACPGCPSQPGDELNMLRLFVQTGPEIMGRDLANQARLAARLELDESLRNENSISLGRLGYGQTSDEMPAETKSNPWVELLNQFADTLSNIPDPGAEPKEFEKHRSELSKNLDDMFKLWEFSDFNRVVFKAEIPLYALELLAVDPKANAKPALDELRGSWDALESFGALSQSEKADLAFIRRRFETASVGAVKSTSEMLETVTALKSNFTRWKYGGAFSRLGKAIGDVEGAFDPKNPATEIPARRPLERLLAMVGAVEDREVDQQLANVEKTLTSMDLLRQGGYLPDSLIRDISNQLRDSRLYFEKRAAAPAAAAKPIAAARAGKRDLRLFIFVIVAVSGVVGLTVFFVLQKKSQSAAPPV